LLDSEKSWVVVISWIKTGAVLAFEMATTFGRLPLPNSTEPNSDRASPKVNDWEKPDLGTIDKAANAQASATFE
jgi:hypothetical protein